MINKVLNDRYEILELIGRGGMAYVYKAMDTKLNRYVAIKVLREEYTENEQFIKKFDRESQAAAGLTHPNIVSIYDVGVEEDIYFIIMEYVDGITLKQYLNKKGHLDYLEAIDFIVLIAEALSCAHENKIIHRDIKPHNILLTKDNTPKVADFGIARAITSSTVTMTNQTMGSVHYISPEQARGSFVDERSDLYSLGIMFYELLTGELPFDEESTVTIAIKHIQDKLVPPQELRPEIPNSVNEVVVKLTQKKPDDRYQSMEELIEDLTRIKEDVNVEVLGASAVALAQDGAQNAVNAGNGVFTVTTASDHPMYEPDYDDTLDQDFIQAKRKKRRNNILGFVFGLAVLAVLTGILINTVFLKRIVIPELHNKSLEEAQKEITDLGLVLEVEKEVNDANIQAGHIISQNPEAGKETTKGKSVRVTVSKGVKNVEVPDVRGYKEDEAIRIIENAHLMIEKIEREHNSEVESGMAYGISPSVGTSVPEGTKVTLFISKGKDLVVVPGIVGLTEADARARISNNGLTVGTITTAESDFYAAGLVISQSPAEGTEIESRTAVNFVVSTGKPKKTDPFFKDDKTDPPTPAQPAAPNTPDEET